MSFGGKMERVKEKEVNVTQKKEERGKKKRKGEEKGSNKHKIGKN
jgi:hypothetical protein